MSGIGTGYDVTPTTYSPEGRIFQVEYAARSVENSSTAIGIRVSDGVIFGVEKKIISKMLVKGSNRRVGSVGDHIGASIAGLTADGRRIIKQANSEAKSYKDLTSEAIPLNVLVDRISSFVQMHTLYASIRPFGCAVMFGSYNEKDGAQLFLVEPSGVSFGYYGCAIGKAKQSAKTEIEKLNLSELTCREAIKQVAKIIYTIHDESKDKEMELEMSWICKESGGKHELVPDDLIAEAEQFAKDNTVSTNILNFDNI
ncbi:proteasome subunit alpha type-3 [Anaeramoeba ignava]|uniref:Proteasome subunit alpha type n=1 Tax=Anaeramoeba ignava TaxID=1746090 RepID=A0A9Q0LWQ2_ANAIG|nr:proteasome subunit alpha type-3 [Anaeramoeba ignava]